VHKKAASGQTKPEIYGLVRACLRAVGVSPHGTTVAEDPVRQTETIAQQVRADTESYALANLAREEGNAGGK
jgi:hypothetical protein